MKKVNIIMPVHNRWSHTEQSLNSLFEHTDPSLFSVCVINDGSDEETTANLSDMWNLSDPAFDFSLVHNNENIGPGASRNVICGVISKENRRAKYLYHSDNDVYFTEGWLEKLIEAYEIVEQNGIRLLGGGCHPYLQNNGSIELYIAGEHAVVGIKDAVSGYSQLMTWETWDKYGPFDETMRGAEKKIAGSEDWAFCQKIREDGFEVGALYPEVVLHTGKTNTYGEPATGVETFKDVEGVAIV